MDQQWWIPAGRVAAVSGTIYVCEVCGATANIVTADAVPCFAGYPGHVPGLLPVIMRGPVTALCQACADKQSVEADDDERGPVVEKIKQHPTRKRHKTRRRWGDGT